MTQPSKSTAQLLAESTALLAKIRTGLRREDDLLAEADQQLTAPRPVTR